MPNTTLSDVVKSAKLELPVDDQHTYHVSKVSGRDWLRLQDLLAAAEPAAATPQPDAEGDDTADQVAAREVVAQAAAKQATKMSTIEMYRLCLGDQFDEIAANHDADVLAICATTAYFWQIGNPAVADYYWSTGGKAPAPTPAQPEPKTPSGKGGAAASTTRTRTSGSGTKTPATTRPRAAKTTSRGRKSSATAK